MCGEGEARDTWTGKGEGKEGEMGKGDESERRYQGGGKQLEVCLLSVNPGLD